MPDSPSKGVIVAAPSSGAGKTLATLGLLRALKNKGLNVASAKVGPDYIDPRFHEAASGTTCTNMDPWAMRKSLIARIAGQLSISSEICIIEGVMGLFDGADSGAGSTSDLAQLLSLPVVLVIDAKSQAQSVAALAKGFSEYDPKTRIGGILFNRVASNRHEEILRKAVKPLKIPVVGAIRTNPSLQLPSRHLGLIQAEEHADLESFIETAANMITDYADIDLVQNIAEPLSGDSQPVENLPPLGQRIAIAKDTAFGFTYPHLIDHWIDAGAEIKPFSPLANEIPSPDADAIFLPGGYPELHAAKIASNTAFLDGLRNAAGNDTLIYGECGGYMVLGQSIIDKDGNAYRMAGLLPHTTSFQDRQLHLGYRQLKHDKALPWSENLRGHEFHYSTTKEQGQAETLFFAKDSTGNEIGRIGQRIGKVMGSFAHIVDVESNAA